ncbi:MAG TPA: hypothetical protein DHU55_18335 [Blastocatellia bacterium]|nr:hypothetical protein [Blastocatellia bacterium]
MTAKNAKTTQGWAKSFPLRALRSDFVLGERCDVRGTASLQRFHMARIISAGAGERKWGSD